ncbi:MAG: DUF4091 domain-containing protein [Enterococcus lacertideformus]|uniref:DUF4091 domain-containing protein n=1 Tax=Enterococcus lacertideformus TaxID=2771493 RepID=A0A931AUS6_9ENTE|nr:DUF4091 domain-containing protein [Enterococcus lacertideformus]
MRAYLVHESYKASNRLTVEQPNEIQELILYGNSNNACQLLLHDGAKNHFVLSREFSIPDAIEIPTYRVAIQSSLPVNAQFIDYYIGSQDILYADKLLEQTAKTYSGDRYAPIYLEFPIDAEVKAGSYDLEITVYQSHLTGIEEVVASKKLTLKVSSYCFPEEVANDFNLDIWQQPSNLARSFQVPLWSDAHFQLIEEMAISLAKIGQKAVTVIAGEIPWKGWFNYIVKDYPANLYEYSMINVKKDQQGELVCDFSVLDRYLNCMVKAGIDQEIDVFGLLGVWQPPFFPLIKNLDYPEKIVVRYFDEVLQKVAFIESKSELKSVDETVQIKVAFDKEKVLEQLISEIDYPVTSFYCTCKNYQKLTQSYPDKTQYYICNYPDRPNTFLHSSLLETRIQGVLAHCFKTNGLLRWAYNCWPENVREDIRYNTSSLPIGDNCLIYPAYSGHVLLSLRYKQLQRGIEDFYLIKQAEKQDETKIQQLINTFIGSDDPKEWMVDSHTINPMLFNQTDDLYEEFRKQLIGLVL